MKVMIIHKIQMFLETSFVLLALWLQPVAGVISAIAATVYFMSMLKHNIIDVHYEGSWKKYLAAIFKKAKK
jgi:hypothetical protein